MDRPSAGHHGGAATCGRRPSLGRATLTLQDLVTLLGAYAASEVRLATLHARLLPILSADPLDVSASDASRWDAAPAEERLFWRLVYLLEREQDDSERLRAVAGRIVGSLRRTGSAEVTHELLPVLLDQGRLAAIIEKYRRGIITRTGFLCVVAESGYPEHVKLWLRHASVDALGVLAERLDTGRYDEVSAAFEERPG